MKYKKYFTSLFVFTLKKLADEEDDEVWHYMFPMKMSS